MSLGGARVKASSAVAYLLGTDFRLDAAAASRRCSRWWSCSPGGGALPSSLGLLSLSLASIRVLLKPADRAWPGRRWTMSRFSRSWSGRPVATGRRPSVGAALRLDVGSEEQRDRERDRDQHQ
jgi:hypothetical protein